MHGEGVLGGVLEGAFIFVSDSTLGYICEVAFRGMFEGAFRS